MRLKSFCTLLALLTLFVSSGFFFFSVASAEIFTPIQNGADFFVSTTEQLYSGYGKKGNFFPSNNDGSFGVQTETADLVGNLAIDAADMDGDGDNDILIRRGYSIHLLRNDGSGSFSDEPVLSVQERVSTYLRIADFNNDGRNDFVVGDAYLYYGISLYLQDELGNFNKVEPSLDLGTLIPYRNTGIIGLAAGDVNGDGNADIVGLGYWGGAFNRIYLYLGDGAGKMSPQIELLFLNYNATGIRAMANTGLALLDFEGDGDLDIALGGSAQPSISEYYVLTNDGSGNFSIPAAPAFFIDSNWNTVMDDCDFDKDGDGDLVISSISEKTLYYVENLGGAFAEPVVVGYAEYRQHAIGASPAGTLTRSAEEQLEDLIADVLLAQELIFSNANQAGALSNKFAAILEELNRIDENTSAEDALALYQDLLNKLKNDVLAKTDGFYGGNSKNDWVITQEGQDYLYPKVDAVINAIKKEIAALTGA